MNKNEDKTVNTEVYNQRLMNNVVRMPFVAGSCYGSEMSTDGAGPLLDYWGDEGVCSLGYNTPDVIQAVMRFFSTGQPHQLPDIYPNQSRYNAANIICDRTGMDKVFFANSGTEANESAIKLARKYWWDKEGQPMRSERYAEVATRSTILTVEGNFHGRTGISLAAGDFRVSPYHRWGFGPIAQGFGVLEAQDTELGLAKFVQVVTDGCEHEPRQPDWGRVAAIILAPVLGNNCVKTYPQSFWAALKAIRDIHGVLIIYDDVQAGSGRAGYFATWQHPDIQLKPDIMTLAKGIAMGYPMSCMLASEGVAKAFTPGVHFNTFGGSPFVCHMATEMYKWLDRNLESVRANGELIRQAFADMPWVAEHDGSGMLNAFTPAFQDNGYDGFMFVHKARELGLSLATHRKYGAIRFTPRLNVALGEIRKAMDILSATHHLLKQ